MERERACEWGGWLIKHSEWCDVSIHDRMSWSNVLRDSWEWARRMMLNFSVYHKYAWYVLLSLTSDICSKALQRSNVKQNVRIEWKCEALVSIIAKLRHLSEKKKGGVILSKFRTPRHAWLKKKHMAGWPPACNPWKLKFQPACKPTFTNRKLTCLWQ